jgi:hypothetical protein
MAPEALFLTALVERLATARLPGFLTDHYRLCVSVTPISNWDTGGRIAIELAAGTERFSAQHVADGFKLWLEIALRDAAGVVEAGVRQLARHIDHFTLHDHTRLHMEALEASESSRRYLGEVLPVLLADPIAAASEFAEDIAALARGSAVTEAFSQSSLPLYAEPTAVGDTGVAGGRVFIIDEPERHLHPRLQRKAAAWLQRAATDEVLGGQFLLATHSVSMLSMSGAVAYTHVGRPLGATVTTPLPQALLTALDPLSDALGWDRGELLTLRNVFAFVEGPVDKIVFDTLFGGRLRAAGVELIPLHGTKKMAAVLEADVLFDLMRQRIAVVVDNVVQSRLRDETELEAARTGNRTADEELKKVAELRFRARNKGRHVESFSIPHPDVIRALDEDVLGECFGYPGHAVADTAWEEAKRHNPNASWKRTAKALGLRDDEASIAEVVDRMRRRGLEPDENLRRVVEDLEGYAAA